MFKLTIQTLLVLFLPFSPLIAQQDLQTDVPKMYSPPAKYDKAVKHSFYLTMRDGIDLAIDLFLPKGLEPGTKIPAILHQTRYWRGLDLRWPFTNAMGIGPPSLTVFADTEEFVKQGYAVVSVDARGSGASTGIRTTEMGKDEVEDGREVLDWIVAQDWSNGNVGAVGISYNGWAAQMLASLGHPALKAIIPMHAPFDGFREMAVVGGVPHYNLVADWTDICITMDGGELAGRVKGAKLALKGFPLVSDDPNHRKRRELCELHSGNNYFGEYIDDIQYRDDTLAGLDLAIDDLFPVGSREKIKASGVAVYSTSGWYDINGTSAATRQFMNYDEEGRKLLFGAWNHGGRKLVSPFAPGVSAFSRLSEFLKFFDYHLKGIDNGLYEEPRVHYYHLGEEVWKSADSWPPADVEMQGLYLGPDSTMGGIPAEEGGFDNLLLDTTTYVGFSSRWELSSRCLSNYDTLLQQVDSLLSYKGPIATSITDITGVPEVSLWVESPAPDGACFVYLMDESPEGQLRVMSQGHLRLIHRSETHEGAPYKDHLPYRSFLSHETMEMPIGEPVELHFGLTPISWQLKPGHRVRLLLCGSDRSHFSLVGPQPFTLKLLRSAQYPSHLSLPVLPRENQ